MNLINPGNTEINAYCYVAAEDGSPSITKAKGVTSITDSGVGQYTVNMTALASADYSWAGSVVSTHGNAGMFCIWEVDTRSTTALPVRISTNSNTAIDADFSLLITGA